MYDICCIGHITLDKVITPKSVVRMAGGTSYYFSNAIRNMGASYILITSLAEEEMDFVESLRVKGIEVNVKLSAHTVYFENKYSGNQDHREQRVLQKADPFSENQVQTVDAHVFHLGPLLADDFPDSIIKKLAVKGKLSLDAQGYLRKVENKKVYHVDWPQKRELLQHIHYLKANEFEMEVLTGLTDIKAACETLYDWGVKEPIITLGSKGSVIYDGKSFYSIPAFQPSNEVIDATGCGDTYMAGYLYQRTKGVGHYQAGEFAAAMATLKIESSGPFTGSEKDVEYLIKHSKSKIFPILDQPQTII